MDCTDTRTLLLARRRGALDDAARAEVDRHLSTCDACRAEDAADRALSDALERMPRRTAPTALVRTLEAQLSAAPSPTSKNTRRGALVALASALAVAAAAFLFLVPREPGAIVTEAVNDHLRVLYSTHPLEVESGGVHQVKPWFEGRVDFAPVVGFGGDDDFPLLGGSVGYFVDRKAATYVYKRRLHLITLFVFRAEGLSWPSFPSTSTVPLAGVRARRETSRGFHVLFWRQDDLGYALVSDLDPRELETLGGKIAARTPP
jgi:anti-sigma factor RsiW